ncbi:MAG: hypothetical protein ACFFAS_17560 [Promethearchaeota archaeon]
MYSDIFIYLDLTKNILKLRDIIKPIKNYIEEKNKINLKGHFAVLIFQEEGNPVFITNKKDSEIITKAIEENWKNRAKKTSYFENGLFYIFSYIAETVRKKSKYNRIIVITDTPSDLSQEYQEALFNLVSKIKYFPTFIDIIRIAEEETRFQKDDVKLNILASDTKGGIFYVKDRKEFSNTMKKLVKSKQLVGIFEGKEYQIKIKSEDYDFYNNLAKHLLNESDIKEECYFCKNEICPVCTNVNDAPLLCPDCKSGFHTCCVINYTINNNIGIPHIFRCPICDILLQINQNLIVQVEEPEIISIEKYIEKDLDPTIIEIEETQQDKAKLKSEQINESANLGIMTQSEGILESEKEIEDDHEKIIRVGGFFGKVYSVKKVEGKLVYNRIDREKKKHGNIIICPQCGVTVNKNISKKCKECGYEL